MFSCEFCEISKNTFFRATVPEAHVTVVLCHVFKNICSARCSLFARTCNPANFQVEFGNCVSSMQVGGNSPTIGQYIV